MGHLWLVSAVPRPSSTFLNIEQSFASLGAWYRFGLNQWVVFDQRDLGAAQIFELIKGHVAPEGQVFINRLHPWDRNGWMPKQFWDWLSQLPLT